MKVLEAGLYALLEEDHPATVRQVFYRAVSAGLIEKKESEYKNVVGRLLSDMRRRGELPWGWITDSTRVWRKPQTYTGLHAVLEHTAQFYRRDIWEQQDVYVEVWCEKDTLSGVLLPITSKWDVPLLVTRGYPSITFLHSAAEDISSQGKPAFIYYLGDHDPTGLHIPVKVEEGLREWAPDAEIHFERIAVTEQQIGLYNLPTRPTKKSDTRARNFEGESVEVDAIRPARLRSIVETHILQHVDDHALNMLKIAEASERDYLRTLVDLEGGGA